MTDEPHDKPARPDRGFRPGVNYVQPDGSKGSSFVLTPEGAFAYAGGQMTTIADAVDFFWTAVAADPRRWDANLKGYDWLLANAAAADREDVRRALGWLEGAIALKDRTAAVAACRYLAALPAMLLAADYARVLGIFNSRKVGMVWAITPDLDVKPLPAGPIPRFGQEAGFGLIRAVPELYIKLALFGPEMEAIVAGLAAEAIRYGVSLPPELVDMAGSAGDAEG